ncbi:GNAT family N-acetyltransferase [Kitasatospora sp. NPDC048540]|uniref:GNAT family N-acetyltransferase n=1 Tax=unclassified Kitasatospora TaxID=2633591 RepID=UPI00053BAFBA|nr:GNAT family N-acetyltransferase [Kitasatospora sp. MBT63]
MTLTVAAPAVRIATAGDAAALFVLSAPFMRSGELRDRGPADYRERATDFLIEPGDREPAPPAGCVALRPLAPEPGHPAAGLLYNLCVHPARQGTGVGSRLLAALLARAEDRGLRTVYAASTGSAVLFLRTGFRQVPTALAPAGLTSGLDPARGSRVYRYRL